MTKFSLIMIMFITLSILSIYPYSSHAQPSEEPYLYSRINPSATYSDNPIFTLEVYTTGNGIKKVTVKWRTKTFELRDDGVDPDKKAGDGVYTGIVDLTGEAFSFSSFWSKVMANVGLRIVIETTSGEVKEYDSCRFAIVKPEVKFPVVKLGDGLYATPYAFFIVDKKGEIFPDFPVDDMYCGKTYPEAYKKLYSVFPDIFDFITLMPGGTLYRKKDYGENVPYFVMAKNEVKNIGVPIFDDTQKYGSKGRLMGVIYHSYGYGAILDHEVGHAWGVDIGKSLGIATDKHHWIANSDIYGQMSEFYYYEGNYYKFIDNGDGTFKAVKNIEMKGTVPYSPLMLYIMGLIPPEEVPPIHVLEGEIDFSNPDRVKPERIREITIWDIIEAEGGERDPPYEKAQKDFTMAFIIVKPDEFTPAEFAYYSLISKFFGSCEEGENYLTPFCTATDGRGHMNTTLPIPLFNASISQTCLEAYPEEDAQLEVNVIAIRGYNKEVQVKVEGLPSDFQVLINPSKGKPPFKSTIRISIPAKKHGKYSFKVLVSSLEDLIEYTFEATLYIPKVGFQLYYESTEKTAKPGGEVTFMIKITEAEEFKKTVKIQVINTQPKLIITPSPGEGVPPFTSTIHVKLSENTPAGKHCFVVKAIGDSITDSVDLCVNVKEAKKKIELKHIYAGLMIGLALIVIIIIIVLVKRRK